LSQVTVTGTLSVSDPYNNNNDPNNPNSTASSKLNIVMPQSLYKENGYDHREALFGSSPYGGSIAQNLYYADSDLCDATVDPTRGYPERKPKEAWPSPFILLVDRGGCSFVRKVRNAQHAGAAAVLIADNLCLCNDQDCINHSHNDNSDSNNNNSNTDGGILCQQTEPIMADDGSGGDIAIPSFLLFKKDADQLKSVLKENTYITAEMSWSLPKPDDRVEYDLFTVPSELISKDFQSKWKPIALAFKDRAYFTPHQFIYDGDKSHCHLQDGRNMCFNLCTNNGRYCATDPDNDLEHGISGADVVTEALRRVCIWNHYGASDGIGEKYWDYIAKFIERCDTPEYFTNSDCLKDVYKQSKVDANIINRCMTDSGGLEGDVRNTFLDLEIKAQNARGIVVLPTMFVNTVALRGGLTTAAIFNAICAGYLEGTEPSICETCRGCSNASSCVTNGYCDSDYNSSSSYAKSGISKRTFGLSLFFLSAVFSFAGYIHWKKTREEMRDQVRGILAEYMPLTDGDDDHDNDGSSPLDFARKGQRAALISS
jgi:hypothetical protein